MPIPGAPRLYSSLSTIHSDPWPVWISTTSPADSAIDCFSSAPLRSCGVITVPTGNRSFRKSAPSFHETITHTPAGDLAVELKLPGEHNVSNALAAVAVAAFDHGEAPPGYSDRQFRFDYLDQRIVDLYDVMRAGVRVQVFHDGPLAGGQ